MNNRSIGYGLLWLVALTSLALNALLIYALLNVQTRAGQALSNMAASVGKLQTETLDYTAHIEQTIPIVLSVPISQTVSVPIVTTVPIRTQVTGSISTFFGAVPIDIPIQTDVPVNIRTDVPIYANLPVSTTVPVVLDVPVHIKISDTGLGQGLLQTQAALEALSEAVSANPLEALEELAPQQP